MIHTRTVLALEYGGADAFCTKFGYDQKHGIPGAIPSRLYHKGYLQRKYKSPPLKKGNGIRRVNTNTVPPWYPHNLFCLLPHDLRDLVDRAFSLVISTKS